MNGVQTRFKCKLDVKRCKRFVFPPSSLLPRSNALKTKAIRYFQTDRTLTRIVSPPLSPLEKENIMNEVDHVIVYGKIPQKSICIPNITNDLYSPDFIYVVQRADGKKELNIVIETKDIPNDEAKRTVEDAKINNAERFFQQLKIDGYEVKFCRQLQNKKMANIISELLEEDASNPV